MKAVDRPVRALVQDSLTGQLLDAGWLSVGQQEALRAGVAVAIAPLAEGEPSANLRRWPVSAFRSLGADIVLIETADAGPGGEAFSHPFLQLLELTLESRRHSTADRSYTKRLLDGGARKIGEKLREEADELACALAGEGDERVVNEAADVLYHLLVGLRFRQLPLRSVFEVLVERARQSGPQEKSSRQP